MVEEPSDRSEAGEDLVPDPSRFMVHPVPGETDEPKPRMVTVGTEEIMVTACVGVVATIYKAWRVDPEWGDHTVAEPMTRYLQIGHGLEDDPEAQFATAYRAILLAYPDLDPTSRRTDGEIITIDL